MKNILFLDDIRTPRMVFHYDIATAMQAPFNNEEKWDIVRDYNEFVDYIRTYYESYNKLPELITFDHDLADVHYTALTHEAINNMDCDEKTGYDCAKWLVDFCIDNNLNMCKYLCHSQNPAGKENILGLLNNFNKFQENQK